MSYQKLTRDIAIKFNATYSETFKVPDIDIPKAGARVMSLQEPTRKMSKSDENQNGCLYLADDPKALPKKIMSAVTDSDSGPGCVRADESKPGVTNLLAIYCAMSGKSLDQAQAQFAEASYADFKTAVADAVVESLTPIRDRYSPSRMTKPTSPVSSSKAPRPPNAAPTASSPKSTAKQASSRARQASYKQAFTIKLLCACPERAIHSSDGQCPSSVPRHSLP